MGRGGYREGSGPKKKPPEELTQMVSFRLARHLVAAIRRLSVGLGVSQAKVIERAVLLLEGQLKEAADVQIDPPEA
jgi:hypothetical protein